MGKHQAGGDANSAKRVQSLYLFGALTQMIDGHLSLACLSSGLGFTPENTLITSQLKGYKFLIEKRRFSNSAKQLGLLVWRC